MKQYIAVNEDTFIEYDSETKTSRVIMKSNYLEMRDEIQAEIDRIDNISDADLLIWAKENYPSTPKITERENLQAEIVRINNILNELNVS